VTALFAGAVDGQDVVLLQGLAQPPALLRGVDPGPLPRVALVVRTPGQAVDPDLGVTDVDVVPPGADTLVHRSRRWSRSWSNAAIRARAVCWS
jgi:hypothetical protein